jgi:hypothetical protein
MKTRHMAYAENYDLSHISEYDEDKLTKVIDEYNQWYGIHVKESDREHKNQTAWAYAIYEIKDAINKNMVDSLCTLEETQVPAGEGRRYFDVSHLFLRIDNIREELISQVVHKTLLEMDPVLLTDILNKLEICTRHVIQNTSIRRLEAKSQAHAASLLGHGAGGELHATDALLPPVLGISTLLRQMKQF